MSDDCRCPEEEEETEVVEKEKCCLKKVVSNTLDVTGGCPECETVRVELKEVPPCKMVTSMMNNDIISFKRNGTDFCIKFSDLLVDLGCKTQCLE